MAQFIEHHLLQALRRFDQQHLPLDLFLSHYFRSHKALGAKDRRAIGEAVYGMTRWKALLDHLLGQNPGSWERRYALYKGFQPTQFLTVPTIPLHVRVSFPKELFNLLKVQYGEAIATELCQISNTQAPVTVRINPLKTTREALLQQWQGQYEVEPTLHSPLGITFKKRIPFFEMAAFKEGLFEVQDEGSQLCALTVECEPGDHVLDFCAGSGGKTLAFAHQMHNKGQITLHDVRPIALEQAKKRLARAGVSNTQFLTSTNPQLENLKGKMDWVLADVPCSGTGTLRRNPDMKWKFDPSTLPERVAEQRAIFEQALTYLKPGGKIVYVTCSLLKEENDEQIAYFQAQHGLQIVGEPFASLPTLGGMDGFFACTLSRLHCSL